LLNGVHVGTGSIIGAGAVLTEGMRVPPNSVVLGLPARIIRHVDEATRTRIERGWRHYVDQARHHRDGDFRSVVAD
jgi:carbonic anhydrase/acetyltransferase-like protein (isoleucine patch superfamily)